MTLFIILMLLLLAAIANSVMDTVRYRYKDSIFEYWAGKPTPWGRFIKAFAGPDSWQNKWSWDGHAYWKYWGFLLHGPLVGFTSLWHFAKLVMLTSFQLAILTPFWRDASLNTKQALWALLGMKVLFGLVFEFFFPNYENERREILESKAGPRKLGQAWNGIRNDFMGWIQLRPKQAMQLWLIATVSGAMVSMICLGGSLGEMLRPQAWGLAEWLALGWIAIGWLGTWLIKSRASRLDNFLG
ncbi:MAG: hypothetical protein MRZ79_04795 [Bacteroidia bacterium]|nr:hypothetical protein [Bacteroidia bacterium]